MFDHERLEVYQLAIKYVGFSFRLATELPFKNRMARHQWLRASQSIALNIAEGNGKQSLKDRSRFFEIARGSALECAAIQDVLFVCNGIQEDANVEGKNALTSIVNMLTRLIQRSTISEETAPYMIEPCLNFLASHPTPTPTPTPTARPHRFEQRARFQTSESNELTRPLS